MVHRPSWFRTGSVVVSFAETCGINKDGNTLFVVEGATGNRTAEVDDRLRRDVEAVVSGAESSTIRWLDADEVKIGVPTYYDPRYSSALAELLQQPKMGAFEARTIGSLVEDGLLEYRNGHGSPSADLRHGEIPYIKVSDIRAGQVNINPTNMVPRVVAEKHWRGRESGLKRFDLITPIRASKNIGEFAILMPGQESIVLTKEMLVLRSADVGVADNFFLLWALSLKVVRSQWRRVVLMQTNREDVGSRYLEIEIPWPKNPASTDAFDVSNAFRKYYLGVEQLRSTFNASLSEEGIHHVFLGSASGN